MGQVNVALLRAGDTKPNPSPSPTPTPNQVRLHPDRLQLVLSVVDGIEPAALAVARVAELERLTEAKGDGAAKAAKSFFFKK